MKRELTYKTSRQESDKRIDDMMKKFESLSATLEDNMKKLEKIDALNENIQQAPEKLKST